MVERGRQLGRALPHLPSQQHDASPLPLPPWPPPNPRWERGLLLAPLLLPLLPVLPPLLLPKSNLASKLFQVYNRRKIIFLNIHRCQMSHTSIPWFEQIALQNICTCKTLLSGCSNSIYMIMIPSPTAIFFYIFLCSPTHNFYISQAPPPPSPTAPSPNPLQDSLRTRPTSWEARAQESPHSEATHRWLKDKDNKKEKVKNKHGLPYLSQLFWSSYIGPEGVFWAKKYLFNLVKKKVAELRGRHPPTLRKKSSNGLWRAS